ncbi:MAG: DUF502 domain-containing protein [Bacteroidetes bacterium]|nr:DUF502 domain-containing protein [Bacteroidota bacterium]
MKTKSAAFSKILNYFLQGLLLTVPITVTLVVLVQAIIWIDGLLPIHIPITIPGYQDFEIPGVGILVLFLVVTLLGYFASSLVANPFFSMIEKLLGKTPLFKIIYTSVKDLVEAFVGEKKRFTQPVMVTVNNNPVIQRIGFVTENDLTRLGISSSKMAVYLPFSYGFNGQLIIVESDNITELNVSGTEMMKFIISGGVTDI